MIIFPSGLYNFFTYFFPRPPTGIILFTDFYIFAILTRMSAENRKHVTAAFPMLCEGAGQINKLKGKAAHASITVYSDGSRDVGCGYFNRKDNTCLATTFGDAKCIQLFPGKQENVIFIPNQNFSIHDKKNDIVKDRDIVARSPVRFQTKGPLTKEESIVRSSSDESLHFRESKYSTDDLYPTHDLLNRSRYRDRYERSKEQKLSNPTLTPELASKFNTTIGANLPDDLRLQDILSDPEKLKNQEHREICLKLEEDISDFTLVEKSNIYATLAYVIKREEDIPNLGVLRSLTYKELLRLNIKRVSKAR
jgi:hypothetical protein